MAETDPTALESAIRDEAARKIRDIVRSEADEIRKIDDACAAEIGDFRHRMSAQTDARVGQEASKAKSRAVLELKKLRLKGFEAFILRVVEEAAERIREDVRYKRFLLGAIVNAVGRIAAEAEVRLHAADLVFADEIRGTLEKSGRKDVAIVADVTIKWGGCVVVDKAAGRIFDNTIERSCFRKAQAIRREVMRMLDSHPGDAS